MKKIFCILLIFVGTYAFGQQFLTVTGSAPTVSGLGADVLNASISNAFNDALTEINDQLSGFEHSPDNFIRAFANSSVFGSHGATNRAFASYRLVSVSAGSTIGLQLPNFNDIDDLEDNILESGDINLGLSPQLFNLHVGLSPTLLFFLPDNLYLGLRIGFFNLSGFPGIDHFSYNNFLIGVTANYQLLSGVNLGLVQWRGLSIGSGVIFNRTTLEVGVPLDEIREGFIGGQLVMKPRVTFDMNINTVTIPLEVITAVRLIGLNIPFGLGVDLAFGNSDMGIGINSSIGLEGLAPAYTVDSDGNVSLRASGSMRPTFVNPKLMTGLGIVAGPVFLDVPFTYYFRDNGFNIGITLGVRF